MGSKQSLSLTTCLRKIGAAGRKVASLSLVQGLLRSIPGLPTTALAGVVIEAQRQQLAREAEGLRQSLEPLRKQELARADEVATLSTSEVVSRVASRLQEQVSGNRERGTGQPHLDPLTRPALAEESASAGHPLPQGGEGQNNPGGEGQKCLAAGNGEKQPAPDAQHNVLNAALADKDQVLARSEEAHRAELKGAHGTGRSPFWRPVEYFAIGFIAGVLVQ